MATKTKDVVARIGSNPKPLDRPLSVAEKTRICQLFAQFHRVSEVREIIAEEFGVLVDRSTIRRYDASSPHCTASAKMREVFATARKQHLEDLSTVGIAHQVHRLRLLDTMAQASVKKGEFGAAMAALKQAAEEMGGVLTNVKQVDVRHLHLSIDDAKAELAARLGAIVEQQTLLPSPEDDPSDT